jgi:hypothetical protein
MKRQTQEILYHLLPVVFWLLAAGGMVLWEMYNVQFTMYNYIPGIVCLISALLLTHIKRHENAVVPSFQVAVLLGIAAYWLPSVLFLILPVWIYLVYRHLFDLRTFTAMLIGFALVAIWIAVGNIFSIFNFQFSITNNLFVWIPTGIILLAWLGSTIVRQTLRVR